MKGPANMQGRTIQPVLDFGPGFIDDWLKNADRESIELVLEELKRPVLQQVFAQLRHRLESTLVGALKLEMIDDEFITHVRTQTLSCVSLLAALQDEGKQHANGTHRLLATRIETPTE